METVSRFLINKNLLLMFFLGTIDMPICQPLFARYYFCFTQLNMYGFHKIKDEDETFYKHPAFKKDFPELHASIYRKSEKKNSPSDSVKNSEK